MLRRPGRAFVQELERKLRARLEEGLKPIHGEVLNVRVRRCREMPEILPLFEEMVSPGESWQAGSETLPVEPVLLAVGE